MIPKKASPISDSVSRLTSNQQQETLLRPLPKRWLNWILTRQKQTFWRRLRQRAIVTTGAFLGSSSSPEIPSVGFRLSAVRKNMTFSRRITPTSNCLPLQLASLRSHSPVSAAASTVCGRSTKPRMRMI